jgi:hypothetical protein
LAVVGRGRIEHALQLIDALLGVLGLLLSVLGLLLSVLGLLLSVLGLLLSVLGLLLSVLGLLPQLVVAAEQVVEQPLALLRIVRESWYDAHDMKYSCVFMLFKSIDDVFLLFLGIQPACW